MYTMLVLMLLTAKENKYSRQGNDAVLSGVWGMALQGKERAGSKALRQENPSVLGDVAGRRHKEEIGWQELQGLTGDSKELALGVASKLSAPALQARTV